MHILPPLSAMRCGVRAGHNWHGWVLISFLVPRTDTKWYARPAALTGHTCSHKATPTADDQNQLSNPIFSLPLHVLTEFGSHADDACWMLCSHTTSTGSQPLVPHRQTWLSGQLASLCCSVLRPCGPSVSAPACTSANAGLSSFALSSIPLSLPLRLLALHMACADQPVLQLAPQQMLVCLRLPCLP